MPEIYSYTASEADRAEEMIPSMTYATLLQNLGRLTDLGVIAPENTVSMLVVARLVDRARIVRSRIPVQTVQCTLEAYRVRKNPVYAVVKALERAVEIARENEA
jgi:hypothetical protein